MQGVEARVMAKVKAKIVSRFNCDKEPEQRGDLGRLLRGAGDVPGLAADEARGEAGEAEAGQRRQGRHEHDRQGRQLDGKAEGEGEAAGEEEGGAQGVPIRPADAGGGAHPPGRPQQRPRTGPRR